LRVALTVKNANNMAGTVRLTPTLTSTRFSDFSGVPLGTVEVALAAGETRVVTLGAGPFIDDSARAKHYAIGRGGYRIDGVKLQSGSTAGVDTSCSGASFTGGGSNDVRVPGVYGAEDFSRLNFAGS